MGHCSFTVKKRFCERLKRHGVEIDVDRLLKGLKAGTEAKDGGK